MPCDPTQLRVVYALVLFLLHGRELTWVGKSYSIVLLFTLSIAWESQDRKAALSTVMYASLKDYFLTWIARNGLIWSDFGS